MFLAQYVDYRQHEEFCERGHLAILFEYSLRLLLLLEFEQPYVSEERLWLLEEIYSIHLFLMEIVSLLQQHFHSVSEMDQKMMEVSRLFLDLVLRPMRGTVRAVV